MCVHVNMSFIFYLFLLSKRYRQLFDRNIVEEEFKTMTTSNQPSIYDIEMDCFGSSLDRLATTGLNSCVAIVAFLNPDKHIFVEHKSDIYWPKTLNLENSRICFENIANNISKILPESDIT